MSYIICIVGFANGMPCPHEGQWLVQYDENAFGGRGYYEFTDKIQSAKRFDTKDDAWAYWSQQSKLRPTRPDGQPNKPLTALTVLIEPFFLQ